MQRIIFILYGLWTPPQSPGGPEWWKVSLGTDGPLVLQKSIGFS